MVCFFYFNALLSTSDGPNFSNPTSYTRDVIRNVQQKFATQRIGFCFSAALVVLVGLQPTLTGVRTGFYVSHGLSILLFATSACLSTHPFYFSPSKRMTRR